MRITKTKVTAVAASAAALALGAGVAFAYYSATGATTATADLASGDEVQIVYNFGSQALGPGGFVSPTDATAMNGNGYAVSLARITGFDLTTSNPGCDPAWFTATAELFGTDVEVWPTANPGWFANLATPIEVPAGNTPNFTGVDASALKIHMINTNTNQDACKNESVTFTATYGAPTP